MWKRAAPLVSLLTIASLGACGDPPATPAAPVVAEAPRDEHPPADARTASPDTKRPAVLDTPGLRGEEMTWVSAEPYVVFQQLKRVDVRDTKRVPAAAGGSVETPVDGTVNPAKVAQNAEWMKKGELFARRESILLVELHRRFRELFAEPLKLPELSSTHRTLTALVLWNRAAFDKFCAESGQPVSPLVRAFYSPGQLRLVTYIGQESLTQSDETQCAGGRMQKESDRTLCWVATQQLLHEYGAIVRGAPLVDGAGKAPADRAHWFTTGFAEFMSAVEVDAAHVDALDGAVWSHGRALLEDIDTARRSRGLAEQWTIARLLKADTPAARSKLARSLSPGDAATMESAFPCRAWGFVHFLWNYDKGRYRDRVVEFLGLVLSGTESSENFATDIMKRPSADDWGAVEMEFEWYWMQMMNRRTGKDAQTGVWFTPSTDAPEGRAEDDAGFVEAWNADHAPSKR